jgi:hypothetical protein
MVDVECAVVDVRERVFPGGLEVDGVDEEHLGQRVDVLCLKSILGITFRRNFMDEC